MAVINDFHFTSAIFKKVSELDLKTIFGSNKDFKVWIRMSFPFLLLEKIDELWEEIMESVPDIGVHDKTNAQQFIVYFENTWIKYNCHFDRSK